MATSFPSHENAALRHSCWYRRNAGMVCLGRSGAPLRGGLRSASARDVLAASEEIEEQFDARWERWLDQWDCSPSTLYACHPFSISSRVCRTSRARSFARRRPSLDYTTLGSHLEASKLDDSSALTVREVAGYLSVDEKTIYRLAKRGELPGFKVAGTWRFKKGDIDQWIERQKRAVAPAKTQSEKTTR